MSEQNNKNTDGMQTRAFEAQSSEPDFSTVLKKRTSQPAPAQTRHNAPRPPKNTAEQKEAHTRVIPSVPQKTQEDKPAPARSRSVRTPASAASNKGTAPSAKKTQLDWTAPSHGANSPQVKNGPKNAPAPKHHGVSDAQRAVAQHNQNSAAAQSASQNGKTRKKKRKNAGTDPNTGMLNSVLKAVIYIMFVLVTSGFLSYFGITVCNDVFAFIKDTSEIEITIPENADINTVKDVLKDNGIIQYPGIFKLYSSLRKDDGKFVAGDYTVSPSMNYDMLLSAFKEKLPERQELRITIPEGYTIDEIIDLMLENGIGTREGYVSAINEYDFDFWFMDEVNAIWEQHADPDSNYRFRKYRLEGYLFPDTYYFFSDSTEATVIYKMLVRFESLFDQKFRDRCEELHYSVDQIVTLASIIQAEAKYAAEYSTISSVFWNRIKHPNYETQGRLESDATIQYILPERKTGLTDEDLRIDNPYNTYIYKGLTPGAISNPCYMALLYAMYPADTNYYYFVAQKSGYSLFATTHAEHLQNKLSVLADSN